MWTTVVRLFSRLGFARSRRRLDEEARREIDAHLDLLADRYGRAGMTADEARTAARRQFGNVTLVREELHDMNGLGPAALLVDLRDAVRGLRAGKGTTALAFAILTLTLAAGTVTFSVVDPIALRPLPYADADGLVAIARASTTDGNLGGAAPQDFFSWRDETRSFEGLAAAFPGGVAEVETPAGTENLRWARATANLFDVLRVRPLLGRSFTPEEETPGGNSGVVMLTHGLWTRLFGADAGVIGKRIALQQGNDRGTYEIIGVLPPGITYPVTGQEPVQLFRPYVPTPAERDHASGGRMYGLHVVGRLRPRVTLEQARSDVDRVNAAVRAAYSQRITGARYVVLSLQDRVVGPAKPWLLLVLAAVGCVLLVGCVNAGSLLLARATGRIRELATRAALGASRARLARTLLIEGIFLAAGASAVAMALAWWGLALAKAHLPEGLARVSAIAIDARVLTASFAAALLCGLFAGGAPAWRIGRSELFVQMQSGHAIIGTRGQARSLGAFLVAEVSFVAVLLVATVLAVTSFVLVTTADLGFDRRDVMTIDVRRPLAAVPREERPAAAAAFLSDVFERARAVRGVKVAGLIRGGGAPLATGSTRYSIIVPGIGELKGEEMFEAREVSPEYFSAIGLRLLRGRVFDAGDGPGAAAVAVINDLVARRYFAGRDPVGQLVTFRERSTRIIGVVQNVRLYGPEADWRTEIYVPLAQYAWPPLPIAFAQLVVRTDGPAPAMAPAVREAIQSAVAGVTVGEPQFIDEAFRRLTAGRRFNAGLMTLFGLFAVVIGGIGIYGTMAFVVAQQARAIGLRMALGASQSHVLRSILRESLWRVVVGAALGLIGARAAADLFSALVFGVETTSPIVYAGVALGLAAIGLLAAIVPARRAARLDPLTALRAD